MESNYMDDSIKKALENFSADDQPKHWDRMESLLNDPANADLSERAEDQILRNKLNEIQPEAALGHWALMESQLAGLDAEADGELEDMLLDGKAYESLNNLRPPYNEQHWPIMEEKIVAAFSWRKRAVRYKVAELAILLLTFVTIFQYFPEAKEILPKLKKKLPRINAPVAQAPVQEAEIKSIDISTENNPLNSAIAEAAATDSEVNPEATNPDLIATLLPAASGLSNSNGNGTQVNNPESSVLKSIAAKDQSSVSSKKLGLGLTSLDFLSNEQQQNKIEAVPAIPLINLNLLPVQDLPYAEKKINLSKLFSHSSFKIGMYGLSSLDATDNGLDDVAVSSRPTVGYGTGLSMAFKTGRWEVESGLGYLSKTVQPNTRSIEIDQISLDLREVAGTTWLETQYDMINIPVHVRYDVMNRPKWRLFAQAGLSMNINQNVIYRYDQVYLGAGTRGVVPSSAPPGKEKDRADAFEPTEVSTNIGAAVAPINSANSHFNLDIGFGLERAINNRYAAFVQSQYAHKLNEVGSLGIQQESSLFRSMQMRLGIKAILFKKK